MRILLTGAGGPSAVSVWKSLNDGHTLFMADMDPCASGLYLVPPEQRLLVPRGDADSFVDAIVEACIAHRIEVVLSTVDAELIPLAKALDRFEKRGIRLPLPPLSCLLACRDKLALLTLTEGVVPLPHYEVIGKDTAAQTHTFPLFAKPRVSAGSRGAMLVSSAQELNALPQDGSVLLQEWLSGEEYSVDVYITSKGKAIAAVPRLRMKTDSGIAVAARTVHDPELQQLAIRVAQAADVRYVANVQFRRDAQGVARLLEINPRFPGTLPLTTASGVDMPALLIADITGEPLPEELMPFKEVMVLRYLTEQYVDPHEWVDLCQR